MATAITGDRLLVTAGYDGLERLWRTSSFPAEAVRSILFEPTLTFEELDGCPPPAKLVDR